MSASNLKALVEQRKLKNPQNATVVAQEETTNRSRAFFKSDVPVKKVQSSVVHKPTSVSATYAKKDDSWKKSRDQKNKEDSLSATKAFSREEKTEAQVHTYDFEKSYVNCNISYRKFLLMVDYDYLAIVKRAPEFGKVITNKIYRLIASHFLLVRSSLVHRGKVPNGVYRPHPETLPISIRLFDVLAFIGRFTSVETHTVWTHRMPIPSSYYGIEDSEDDYPWNLIFDDACEDLSEENGDILAELEAQKPDFYGQAFFLTLYRENVVHLNKAGIPIGANVPNALTPPHGEYFFDLVDDQKITFGKEPVLAKIIISTQAAQHLKLSQKELLKSLSPDVTTLFAALRQVPEFTAQNVYDFDIPGPVNEVMTTFFEKERILSKAESRDKKLNDPTITRKLNLVKKSDKELPEFGSNGPKFRTTDSANADDEVDFG